RDGHAKREEPGPMIFALIGALTIGLSLGIFGSGGSILTVPVLIYLLHHQDKVAIAESLGIVGAIALISAIPYARAKLTDWRTAILFGLPGMAGTYLGAWFAAFVAGYVQLFVFAGVMVFAAARMWKRSGAGATTTPATDPKQRAAMRIAAQGLCVGVLTGFVGVGGGFLIVPALVLLGGLSMRRAVATSLVIIALNSSSGFWKYLHVLDSLNTTVDWRTIGLFIVIGGVGSFVGKAMNDRINQAALQRGFAIFLVVMAGFILTKESVKLLSRPADAVANVSREQAPDGLAHAAPSTMERRFSPRDRAPTGATRRRGYDLGWRHESRRPDNGPTTRTE
ncbi:MAG: sulfite exporter TauE/SafE family protein, partial [Phycisphaerales bacterium]|nr:sulfite exporter TauE/SafE family protein [Phycisphaerales bacterium]